MRVALTLSLFAVMSWVAIAAQVDSEIAAVTVPGVPPAKIASPDLILRCAAAFVATNDDWADKSGKVQKGHHSWLPCDYCQIRFFSLHDVPTAEGVQKTRQLLSWWLTQLSFNTHVEPLRSVPGTNDRLMFVDMRDYRWNAAAWQAVAERELYMLDGISVDHENAEYLRRRLVAPLSAKAKKGRLVSVGGGLEERKLLLPVGTIVTATQFLRDAIETDRSNTYYDMLFARERFTDVVQTGGASEKDGTRTVKKKIISVPLVPKSPKLYVDDGKGYSRELKPETEFPPGKKVYVWRDEEFHPWVVPPVKEEELAEEVPTRLRSLPEGVITSTFVNFPKNVADWESAFGIDKIKAHMREKKLDLDFGAVVEGGKDDPKNGSIVSLQNRLLVTLVGPYGAAMETYDVNETSGARDFTESLIFNGKPFEVGEGAQAIRDAGELLAYLPNGGQAGLLVDGKGNRIETAGNNVAEDAASTTKDKRVRNMGSCVVCHAPEGGYILPRDVIADGRSKGLKIVFKDREQQNRTAAFFKAQAQRVKAFTEPYQQLLAETTAIVDPKTKKVTKPGWTGIALAKEFEAFRKDRDAPLDLERAAAEIGVPKEALIPLLKKTPFLRAQMLVQGKPVPRRVWEVSLYPQLQTLRQAELDETARRKK